MNSQASIPILIIVFSAIFAAGEFIATLLFKFLDQKFKIEKSSTSWSQLKGHLERLMLSLGLVSNIPSVLIVFGTLKIGTWLKPGEKEKIQYDYFLIGNFLSVILSISYSLLLPILAIWTYNNFCQ